MNHPDSMETMFLPDFSGKGLEDALQRLLRGGTLLDSRIERSCARLDDRFRTYVNRAPVPQWAPGLLLQGDMRSWHELYLPMDEIRPPFVHICRMSCLYSVNLGGTALFSAPSWPDFLARLQLNPFIFNPALLLRRIAVEEKFRHAFLCALFIPRSYGGSFGRYPLQTAFLETWLARNRERLSGFVTLLDAACGCGEGTYEAAEILLEQGYAPEAISVFGSTLEPLELIAAAFGSYPNDPQRAAVFRAKAGVLLDNGVGRSIRFFREDISHPAAQGKRYDVILCNGLLGGPLFHGKEQLAKGVKSLVDRLNPGGILLAADRFHRGWKMAQQGELLSLLRENRLEVIDAGEGVAGVKSESAARPRRVRRQSP
ncbi:MAG TPA: chemotaxis protein CheR [Geobacteraceae bacterium]|nr:chemotaxis protein CheR [Geobacteraceae bacterium]